MITLASLGNTHRNKKAVRRVGRGIGSGAGRTCGRGQKGQGARSGYKRRYGYEGGQFRLYMKLPIRGFSNVNFRVAYDCINLSQIDKIFKDGEVVNFDTLKDYGYVSGKSRGVKILGHGEITKKIKLEVHALSETAQKKLQSANIEYVIIK